MAKKMVLIADLIKEPAQLEQDILGDDVQVVVGLAHHSSDISDDIWRACDAVIAYDALEFDKELISKMDNCKIISRAGIGYDNIDLEAASARGIKVCNVPDYCIAEVANHALAFILSFAAGTPSDTISVSDGKWERMSESCFRVTDKTLGIIGLGRIGSNLAKKALVFDLNVVYYDPYNDTSYDQYERVDSLRELAERSDIVSIHTPLTPETNKMIGAEFFNHCKEGLCLVNTARGNIIEIDELYEAMKRGQVSTCGLDVINIEPPNGTQRLVNDYKSDEGWLRGRLLITPHSSFYTPASYAELRGKAAKNVKRVILGQEPINQIV
ncbi:MAG: hydroxyacid dehydrogenase [Proteobacteria bacterium]|nr:hydroxyacid dehydrogenase [Pseudomonadota bacterium]